MANTKRVIEHIASIMQAARVCRERSEQPLGGDAERWYRRHTAALTELLGDVMPHGSGFDDVSLDHEASNDATQLVFDCPFHVMNDAGYYVGWAHFRVVATPSFIGGFDLAIEQTESCGDVDAEYGLDDLVCDAMHEALSAEFAIPSHYYADI